MQSVTEDAPLMVDTYHCTHPFFSGSLPMPPAVNAAYKLIKTFDGMRIGPTAELDQFKRDAALMLANQSTTYADWNLIERIQQNKKKTPLFVRLDLYFATQWRRDVDGPVKYAIDAVFLKLGLNDNQITSLYVVKHVDKANPRVEIAVSCDLSSR